MRLILLKKVFYWLIGNQGQSEIMYIQGKNILLQYAKKNDNVLISPHIAGLTYESETKAIRIVLKKI